MKSNLNYRLSCLLLMMVVGSTATLVTSTPLLLRQQNEQNSLRCRTSAVRHISLIDPNNNSRKEDLEQQQHVEDFVIEAPRNHRTGLYRQNEDCRWLLRSDAPLRLHFEQLDVEASPNCRYDSVQIFDNTSYSSYNIAGGLQRSKTGGDKLMQPSVTLCGNATPAQPIITPPGYTLIRFRSDSSNEGRGFMLRFSKTSSENNGKKQKMVKKVDQPQLGNSNNKQTAKPAQQKAKQQHTTAVNQPRAAVKQQNQQVVAKATASSSTSTSPVCNLTLEVQPNGGIIHSYRDPATGLYLANQDCFILLKSSQPLRLTFRSLLHLQDPGLDGICRSDGLVVYNASFSMGERPKNTSHIFCGVTDCNSMCNSLFTDGDAMLRFVTDNANEYRGFTLHYEFAPTRNGVSVEKMSSVQVPLADDQRHVVWWGSTSASPYSVVTPGNSRAGSMTSLASTTTAAIVELCILASLFSILRW